MTNGDPQFLVAPADKETLLREQSELFAGMGEIVGSYFPNSLLVMGRDQELLQVMVALGGIVMRRPGRIGLSLKWLVAHVVSAAAGCRYCTAHTIDHGANIAVDAEKVDAVWQFETSAAFSERERSALRFALAAGQTPNAVTPNHYVELHRHFDDDEIVEIVSVIAYFGFWNRWNDTLSTPLEDEPRAFSEGRMSGLAQ